MKGASAVVEEYINNENREKGTANVPALQYQFGYYFTLNIEPESRN